jgi:hypothetical protein
MALYPHAWQPRRERESTPEYLGRVLEGLGLAEMALRARAGYFDEFGAPSEFDEASNISRLVIELGEHAKLPDMPLSVVGPVIEAAALGEFGATPEEAAAWACVFAREARYAALTDAEASYIAQFFDTFDGRARGEHPTTPTDPDEAATYIATLRELRTVLKDIVDRDPAAFAGVLATGRALWPS